jgi:ABC-2 type transport system permease protein
MSAPSSPRQRIAAHAALELKLLRRSGESLLVTFGVPLGLLVFFGATDVLPTDGDPLLFLVPGVIAIAILSTGFVAQAIQTGFERKYGVLKRLGASPLTRAQFIAGKALSVAVVVIVQVTILLGTALALGWRVTIATPGQLTSLGDSPALIRPGLLVLAVLLGAFAFTALGLALAGAVRAELVLAGSNAVYLAMVALSDLVFDLPAAADPFIVWTPSGALGIALRGALDGATAGPVGLALLVLSGWGLLAVAFATRTFRWEP